MNSFYVHLPSNVLCSFYENKLSHFVTVLGQTLHLDNSWEVGLSEIMYTKSWYNLNTKQKIRLIDETGKIFEHEDVFIEQGFYSNIDFLIEIINEKLKFLCSTIGKRIEAEYFSPPNLTYDKTSMKISEQFGEDISIGLILKPLFDFELASLLGLLYINLNDKKTREKIMSEEWKNEVKLSQKIIKEANSEIRNIDLNAGINALYVYSDIIKPSLIGNTFSKILRIVQIPSVPFGENIQTIFEKPYYIPLSSKEIRSIEIEIKDDTGERIKFQHGKVVCVLHFRKK